LPTINRASISIGLQYQSGFNINRASVQLPFSDDSAPESGADLACRQIHQPAKQAVELPTTVIPACSVTSQANDSALSKKCHVQAHIALMSEGNMPKDRARQAVWPVTPANTQMNQIAAIHSMTLVM
jgi:hypothetical protein